MECHLSGISLLNACDDGSQRGFPAAVFADQPADFTGIHINIYLA